MAHRFDIAAVAGIHVDTGDRPAHDGGEGVTRRELFDAVPVVGGVEFLPSGRAGELLAAGCGGEDRDLQLVEVGEEVPVLSVE